MQPLWQFAVLCYCTHGLYLVYWFYRHWKLLKVNNDLKISPLFRSALFGWLAFSFVQELRSFLGQKLSEEEVKPFSYKEAGLMLVAYMSLGNVLTPLCFLFLKNTVDLLTSIGQLLMKVSQ